MIRIVSARHLFPALALAFTAFGCESGGVGDPCIPEDEYEQAFNGFAVTEVNVESRSFQCETRVCIVNHFQGRVSCPYGQEEEMIPVPHGVAEPINKDAPGVLTPATALLPDDPRRCRIPGTSGWVAVDGTNLDAITEPVEPQLIFRAAEDTVYCSCRCNGPDENARYCECPSGFVCEELVKNVGVPGRGQLVGSYCIKPNTKFDPTHPPPADSCDINVSCPGECSAGSMVPGCATDGNRSRNMCDVCGRDGNGNPANPPL